MKQCESTKDKVPHDVRQRYVNMFTEEFLKSTANVNEAFEKVSINRVTLTDKHCVLRKLINLRLVLGTCRREVCV